MKIALFHLLKLAGIKGQDLAHAGEQDLWGLEKRIHSTHSLNPDFSRNLVETAIASLHKYPKALAYLLDEPTFNALLNQDYKYLFNARFELPDGEGQEQLRLIFQDTLKEDLKNILFELIRQNEWSGVYTWLKLKPVFPEELLHELEEKLVLHLEMMVTDISRLKWKKPQLQEYSFTSNTTFYLVLNQLDSKSLQELWYRFFSEAKGYEVRQWNMTIYDELLDKLKLYRPEDRRFQMMREVTIVLPVNEALENVSGDRKRRVNSKAAWGVGGVILFLVIAFVRVGRLVNLFERNNQKDDFALYEEQRLEREERYKKQARMNEYMHAIDFSRIQRRLGKISLYGSCNKPGIIEDRNGYSDRLEFQKLNLKNGEVILGSQPDAEALKQGKPVIFFNNTKQDIVASLIMSTDSISTKSEVKALPYLNKRVVLIKPGKSIQLEHYLIKFFLHSGKQLCKVESTSRLREEYSWGFCGIDEADSILVNRGFKCFKNSKEFGGKLTINKEDSNYILDWEGKTYMIYDLETKRYVVNYARNPIKDIYEEEED